MNNNQDFHQDLENSIWNNNNLKNIVDKISERAFAQMPPAGCASDNQHHIKGYGLDPDAYSFNASDLQTPSDQQFL